MLHISIFQSMILELSSIMKKWELAEGPEGSGDTDYEATFPFLLPNCIHNNICIVDEQ
jgi:hypothetical protein